MNKLICDYSPVPDEKKDLCEQIQKNICSGKGSVITINGDESENERPIVFKYFNNEYWVQQYVGVIKGSEDLSKGKNEDVTIVIGSRFDKKEKQNHNFLNYVFSKAFDTTGKIFEDMSPNSSTEQTWDKLLMLIYITQLEEALKQGLFRQYRTFYYNDSKVKGRIDVSRQIKLNLMQNGKIAYSTRQYTVDNPINHLILLTYDCLQKKYAENFSNITTSRKKLKNYVSSLKASIPNYKDYNCKTVLRETSRPVYHPYYIKYEALRKTSIMILRRLGLNIFKEDNTEVFGVIIDMNKLWEKFLYNVIFKEISERKESYYKQDTIEILIDTNNKKGKRAIKPDLYIKGKAVFDAKYRKAWSETIENDNSWDNGVRNDVFQVMSYMLALDVDIGGVVFPNSNNDLPLPDGFKVSEYCSKEFYRIVYNVSNEKDYEEFCKQMDDQNKIIKEEIEGIVKIKK